MGLGRREFALLGLAGLLGACRRGNVGDMVVDAKGERMYGMRADGSVFTDAALFPNRRLKLSVRNLSGDSAWDLDSVRERILQGYLAKGYQRSDGIDFGLKVDLNVVRSQQFDRDMMTQFAVFGAVGGAGAGAGINATQGGPGGAAGGAAMGLAAGATLGAIAGQFVADNIYVVVTEATFAVRRNASRPRRVVTFDGSPRLDDWDEGGAGSFAQVHRVTIANYGGGRMISQQEIADDIRERQIRSLISLL
ncbi:MAG: hypothetical protein RLZZ501_545 [Pseudomonadota bacterium]|jgi:hypothetical protein